MPPIWEGKVRCIVPNSPSHSVTEREKQRRQPRVRDRSQREGSPRAHLRKLLPDDPKMRPKVPIR